MDEDQLLPPDGYMGNQNVDPETMRVIRERQQQANNRVVKNAGDMYQSPEYSNEQQQQMMGQLLNNIKQQKQINEELKNYNEQFGGSSTEELEQTYGRDNTFGTSSMETERDIQYGEFQRLGVMGNKTYLEENLAAKQSTWEQLKRAGKRTAQNIFYETIGGIGSMLDVEDYFNTDDEVGNWLTNWAEEQKKAAGDYNQIYKNPNKAWTSSAWWIDNGSNLVSSMASFVAQGALAGGVVSKGVGLLKKLGSLGSKAGLAAKRGESLAEGAKYVDDAAKGSVLGKGIDVTAAKIKGLESAENFAKTAGTVLALNQSEAIMSATEMYKNTYNSALDKGYGMDYAKQVAAEAATNTININRVNMALNLTSTNMLLRGKKDLSNLAKELKDMSWQGKAKNVLKEAAQEAGEETVNLMAEKSSQALADDILKNATPLEGYTRLAEEKPIGSADNKETDSRAGLTGILKSITDTKSLYNGYKNTSTQELFESAFLGALGGAGQTGIMEGAKKLNIGASNTWSDKITGGLAPKMFGEKELDTYENDVYNANGELLYKKGSPKYRMKNVLAEQDEDYEVGDRVKEDIKITDKDGKDRVIQKGVEVDEELQAELKANDVKKVSKGQVKVDKNGNNVQEIDFSKGSPELQYKKDDKGNFIYKSFNQLEQERKAKLLEIDKSIRDGVDQQAKLASVGEYASSATVAITGIEQLLDKNLDAETRSTVKDRTAEHLAALNLIKDGKIEFNKDELNKKKEEVLADLESKSEKDLRKVQEDLLQSSLDRQAIYAAENGAIDHQKNLLEAIGNLSAEEAEEKGYPANYKEWAQESIKRLDKINDMWIEYNFKHSPDIAMALVMNRLSHDDLLRESNEIDDSIKKAENTTRQSAASLSNQPNDLDFKEKFDKGVAIERNRVKELDGSTDIKNTTKTLAEAREENDKNEKELEQVSNQLDKLNETPDQDVSKKQIDELSKKRKELLDKTSISSKKVAEYTKVLNDKIKAVNDKYDQEIKDLGLNDAKGVIALFNESLSRKNNLIKRARALDKEFDTLRSEKGKEALYAKRIEAAQVKRQRDVLIAHLEDLLAKQEDGYVIYYSSKGLVAKESKKFVSNDKGTDIETESQLNEEERYIRGELKKNSKGEYLFVPNEEQSFLIIPDELNKFLNIPKPGQETNLANKLSEKSKLQDQIDNNKDEAKVKSLVNKMKDLEEEIAQLRMYQIVTDTDSTEYAGMYIVSPYYKERLEVVGVEDIRVYSSYDKDGNKLDKAEYRTLGENETISIARDKDDKVTYTITTPFQEVIEDEEGNESVEDNTVSETISNKTNPIQVESNSGYFFGEYVFGQNGPQVVELKGNSRKKLPMKRRTSQPLPVKLPVDDLELVQRIIGLNPVEAKRRDLITNINNLLRDRNVRLNNLIASNDDKVDQYNERVKDISEKRESLNNALTSVLDVFNQMGSELSVESLNENLGKLSDDIKQKLNINLDPTELLILFDMESELNNIISDKAFKQREEDIESDISKLNEEMYSLNDKEAELSNDIEVVLSDIKAIKEEVSQLQQKNSGNISKKTSDKIKSLNTQSKNLRKKAAQLKAQLNKIRTENKPTLDKINKQLNELRNEQARLQELKQQQPKKIADLQNYVKKIQDSLNTYNIKLLNAQRTENNARLVINRIGDFQKELNTKLLDIVKDNYTWIRDMFQEALSSQNKYDESEETVDLINRWQQSGSRNIRQSQRFRTQTSPEKDVSVDTKNVKRSIKEIPNVDEIISTLNDIIKQDINVIYQDRYDKISSKLNQLLKDNPVLHLEHEEAFDNFINNPSKDTLSAALKVMGDSYANDLTDILLISEKNETVSLLLNIIVDKIKVSNEQDTNLKANTFKEVFKAIADTINESDEIFNNLFIQDIETNNQLQKDAKTSIKELTEQLDTTQRYQETVDRIFNTVNNKTLVDKDPNDPTKEISTEYNYYDLRERLNDSIDQILNLVQDARNNNKSELQKEQDKLLQDRDQLNYEIQTASGLIDEFNKMFADAELANDKSNNQLQTVLDTLKAKGFDNPVVLLDSLRQEVEYINARIDDVTKVLNDPNTSVDIAGITALKQELDALQQTKDEKVRMATIYQRIYPDLRQELVGYLNKKKYVQENIAAYEQTSQELEALRAEAKVIDDLTDEKRKSFNISIDIKPISLSGSNRAVEIADQLNEKIELFNQSPEVIDGVKKDGKYNRDNVYALKNSLDLLQNVFVESLKDYSVELAINLSKKYKTELQKYSKTAAELITDENLNNLFEYRNDLRATLSETEENVNDNSYKLLTLLDNIYKEFNNNLSEFKNLNSNLSSLINQVGEQVSIEEQKSKMGSKIKSLLDKQLAAESMLRDRRVLGQSSSGLTYFETYKSLKEFKKQLDTNTTKLNEAVVNVDKQKQDLDKLNEEAKQLDNDPTSTNENKQEQIRKINEAENNLSTLQRSVTDIQKDIERDEKNIQDVEMKLKTFLSPNYSVYERLDRVVKSDIAFAENIINELNAANESESESTIEASPDTQNIDEKTFANSKNSILSTTNNFISFKKGEGVRYDKDGVPVITKDQHDLNFINFLAADSKDFKNDTRALQMIDLRSEDPREIEMGKLPLYNLEGKTGMTLMEGVEKYKGIYAVIVNKEGEWAYYNKDTNQILWLNDTEEDVVKATEEGFMPVFTKIANENSVNNLRTNSLLGFIAESNPLAMRNNAYVVEKVRNEDGSFVDKIDKKTGKPIKTEVGNLQEKISTGSNQEVKVFFKQVKDGKEEVTAIQVMASVIKAVMEDDANALKEIEARIAERTDPSLAAVILHGSEKGEGQIDKAKRLKKAFLESERKKIVDFRNNVNDKLSRGEKVFTAITDVRETANVRRQKKKAEKDSYAKRDMRNLVIDTTNQKEMDGVSFTIGSNQLNAGYVYMEKGSDKFDIYLDKLNNTEAKTLLLLLTETIPLIEYGQESYLNRSLELDILDSNNQLAKDENDRSRSKLPTFTPGAKSSAEAGLINRIIRWTGSPKLENGVYVDITPGGSIWLEKGRIYFIPKVFTKYNAIEKNKVPFITMNKLHEVAQMNDAEFADALANDGLLKLFYNTFLKNKRKQVSKKLLTTTGKYYHPTSISIDGKSKLVLKEFNSYKEYLILEGGLKTDSIMTSELKKHGLNTSRVNRYLEFDGTFNNAQTAVESSEIIINERDQRIKNSYTDALSKIRDKRKKSKQEKIEAAKAEINKDKVESETKVIEKLVSAKSGEQVSVQNVKSEKNEEVKIKPVEKKEEKQEKTENLTKKVNTSVERNVTFAKNKSNISYLVKVENNELKYFKGENEVSIEDLPYSDFNFKTVTQGSLEGYFNKLNRRVPFPGNIKEDVLEVVSQQYPFLQQVLTKLRSGEEISDKSELLFSKVLSHIISSATVDEPLFFFTSGEDFKKFHDLLYAFHNGEIQEDTNENIEQDIIKQEKEEEIEEEEVKGQENEEVEDARATVMGWMSNEEKALANVLLQKADPGVKFIIKPFIDKNVKGRYVHKDKTIIIVRPPFDNEIADFINSKTALHELVHAALANTVDFNQKFASSIKSIRQEFIDALIADENLIRRGNSSESVMKSVLIALGANEKEANDTVAPDRTTYENNSFKRFIDLLNKLAKKDDLKTAHEFIAYGMNNPVFINLLNNIPSKKNGSLLTQLYKLFKDVLNGLLSTYYDNVNKNSLLEALYMNVSEILEDNQSKFKPKESVKTEVKTETETKSKTETTKEEALTDKKAAEIIRDIYKTLSLDNNDHIPFQNFIHSKYNILYDSGKREGTAKSVAKILIDKGILDSSGKLTESGKKTIEDLQVEYYNNNSYDSLVIEPYRNNKYVLADALMSPDKNIDVIAFEVFNNKEYVEFIDKVERLNPSQDVKLTLNKLYLDFKDNDLTKSEQVFKTQLERIDNFIQTNQNMSFDSLYLSNEFNIHGFNLNSDEVNNFMEGLDYYVMRSLTSDQNIESLLENEVELVKTVYRNAFTAMKQNLLQKALSGKEQVVDNSARLYEILTEMFGLTYDESGNEIDLSMTGNEEQKALFTARQTKMVMYHVEKLKKFKINLNVNEDLFDETQLQRDNTGNQFAESFEFDTKDAAPPFVKMMLASMAQKQVIDDKAYEMLNNLGFPKLIEFNQVFNLFGKKLANVPNDANIFTAKLMEFINTQKGRTNPTGKSIGDFLTGGNRILEPNRPTKNVINKIRAMHQFMQTFLKFTPKFYITQYKDGELVTSDAQSKRTDTKILEDWNESYKLLLKEDSAGKFYLPKKNVVDAINAFEAAAKYGTKNQTGMYQEIEKAFMLLGMAVDSVKNLDEQISRRVGKTSGQLITEITKAKGYLVQLKNLLVVNTGENIYDFNLHQSEDFAITRDFIIRNEAEVTSKVVDMQLQNAEGKTIHGLVLNHNLSVATTEINHAVKEAKANGLSGEDMLNLLYERMPHLNNVFNQWSKTKKLLQNGATIEIGYFNGIQGDRDGIALKDMNEVDRKTMLINSTLHPNGGLYTFYRAADRGSELLFRYISSTGTSTSLYESVDDAIDSHVGYLKNEVAAILSYKLGLGKNVLYYGKKGDKWRFFSGAGSKNRLDYGRRNGKDVYLNSDNDLRKKIEAEINALSDLTLEQVFEQADKIVNKYKTQVENSLKAFFRVKAESVKTELEKSGLLADITKWRDKNRASLTKKYSNDVFSMLKYRGIDPNVLLQAGNIDELLYKFEVYQQGAYIEQSLMFTGDPAMFKNEDDFFKRMSMFNSTKKVSIVNEQMYDLLNEQNTVALKDLNFQLTSDELNSLFDNDYDLNNVLSKTRMKELQVELKEKQMSLEDVEFEFGQGYRPDGEHGLIMNSIIFEDNDIQSSLISIEDFDSDKLNVELNNKQLIYKYDGKVVNNPGDLITSFAKAFIQDGINNMDQLNVKLRSYVDAYAGINEADAEAYVTLPVYKQILLDAGDWNVQMEKAYKKAIMGKQLSVDELTFFRKLKTQHTGPMYTDPSKANDPAKLYIPVGYKHSLLPLIPSVIKGTHLEKLNKFMVANKIHFGQYTSANKYGSYLSDGKLMKLYDENGDLTFSNNKLNGRELITQKTYFKYIGIQVDMRPELKEKITVGTQFRKLVLSNLFEKGVPSDFAMENSSLNDTSLQEKWNDLSEEEKNEYEFYRLQQQYINTQNELFNKSFEEIVKELQISTTVEDGKRVYKIDNKDLLINMIDDMAVSRGETSNVRDTIALLRDETSFVEMMHDTEKIENIIYSLVNTRVIREKRKGEGAPQTSVSGWEIGRRKVGVSNTGALRSYRKGGNNRTLPAECLLALPVELMDYVKELGGLDVFNEQLDTLHSKLDKLENNMESEDLTAEELELKKLITIVGFRIPNQGLNSSDVMRVRRFLPTEAADTIVVPSEMTGKAGSDFDIDKLNIYFNEFKLKQRKDETGKLKTYISVAKFYNDSNSTVGERYKQYLETFKLPNETLKEIELIVENEDENVIEYIEQVGIDGLKAAQKQELNSIETEIKNLRKQAVKLAKDELNDRMKVQGLRLHKNYTRLERTLPEEWSNFLKDSDIELKSTGVSYIDRLVRKNELLNAMSGQLDSLLDKSVDLEIRESLTETLKMLSDTVEQQINLVANKDDFKELVNSKLDQDELDQLNEKKQNVQDFFKEVNRMLGKAKRDGLNRLKVENGAYSLEEFSKLPIEKQNHKKALQNRMIDLHEQIITLEYNYRQLMAPVSDALLNDSAIGAVWDIRFLNSESEELDEYLAEKKNLLKQITKNPANVKGYMNNKLELDSNARGVPVLNARGNAEFSEKITSAYYKYKTAWVKKEKAIRSSKPLSDVIDPWVNMSKFNAFLSGKTGVGQVAVHITGHQLGMASNLYANDALNWVMEHNQSTLGEKPTVSFAGKRDTKGEWISETLSAFLNAYVDVAKDPYIFDLNAGLLNANMIFMLVRGGVSPTWITRFLSQPIIKTYTQMRAINESALVDSFNDKLSEKELVNAVLGKEVSKETPMLYSLNREQDNAIQGILSKAFISNSYDGIAAQIEQAKGKTQNSPKYRSRVALYNRMKESGLFTEEALADYISSEDDADERIEEAILDLYLEYQRQSSHFQKMTRATSADTKGVGKNRSSVEQFIRDQREVLLYNGYANVDKMIEQTIVKVPNKTVEFAYEAFSSLYSLANDQTYKVMNNRILNAGRTDLRLKTDDLVRLATTVQNDFILALAVSIPGSNLNSEKVFNELFLASPMSKYKDENGKGISLPEVLIKIRNNDKKFLAKNPKLRVLMNNKFLREMAPFVEKNQAYSSYAAFESKNAIETRKVGFGYINGKFRKMTNIRKEELERSLLEIRNNPDTNEIYNDIFRYSLLQSGFNNSPVSFTNLMIAEDVARVKKEAVEMYLNSTSKSELVNTFINQFYRKNYKYLPKVRNGRDGLYIRVNAQQLYPMYVNKTYNTETKSTAITTLVITSLNENGSLSLAAATKNDEKNYGIIGHTHYFTGYNLTNSKGEVNESNAESTKSNEKPITKLTTNQAALKKDMDDSRSC